MLSRYAPWKRARIAHLVEHLERRLVLPFTRGEEVEHGHAVHAVRPELPRDLPVPVGILLELDGRVHGQRFGEERPVLLHGQRVLVPQVVRDDDEVEQALLRPGEGIEPEANALVRPGHYARGKQQPLAALRADLVHHGADLPHPCVHDGNPFRLFAEPEVDGEALEVEVDAVYVVALTDLPQLSERVFPDLRHGEIEPAGYPAADDGVHGSEDLVVQVGKRIARCAHVPFGVSQPEAGKDHAGRILHGVHFVQPEGDERLHASLLRAFQHQPERVVPGGHQRSHVEDRQLGAAPLGHGGVVDLRFLLRRGVRGNELGFSPGKLKSMPK